MAETKVKVKFAIAGTNFDPYKISKKIGIDADNISVDKKIYLKPYEFQSSWSIEKELQPCFNINELLSLFYNLLKGKESIIAEILNINEHMFATLDVVIYIEQNSPPGIHLEKEFINFMAKAGISIDIDVYIYS